MIVFGGHSSRLVEIEVFEVSTRRLWADRIDIETGSVDVLLIRNCCVTLDLYRNSRRASQNEQLLNVAQ